MSTTTVVTGTPVAAGGNSNNAAAREAMAKQIYWRKIYVGLLVLLAVILLGAAIAVKVKSSSGGECNCLADPTSTDPNGCCYNGGAYGCAAGLCYCGSRASAEAGTYGDFHCSKSHGGGSTVFIVLMCAFAFWTLIAILRGYLLYVQIQQYNAMDQHMSEMNQSLVGGTGSEVETSNKVHTGTAPRFVCNYSDADKSRMKARVSLFYKTYCNGEGLSELDETLGKIWGSKKIVEASVIASMCKKYSAKFGRDITVEDEERNAKDHGVHPTCMAGVSVGAATSAASSSGGPAGAFVTMDSLAQS